MMTEQQNRIYDILTDLDSVVLVDLFLNYHGTQLLEKDFMEFVREELGLEEEENGEE